MALKRKGIFIFEGSNLCQLGIFEMIDFRFVYLKSDINKSNQILQDFLIKKTFSLKILRSIFFIWVLFKLCMTYSSSNKADCHKLHAPSNEQPTDQPTNRLTDRSTEWPTKWLIELRARDWNHIIPSFFTNCCYKTQGILL